MMRHDPNGKFRSAFQDGSISVQTMKETADDHWNQVYEVLSILKHLEGASKKARI